MTKLHLETIIPLPREEYFTFAYSKDYDVFQAKHINLKNVEELEFFQKVRVKKNLICKHIAKHLHTRTFFFLLFKYFIRAE